MLRKMLRRCRAYGLKMNPKKCAFGVSSCKFLGFLVHQRNIAVDLDKVRTKEALMPQTNAKELKNLMGKLSYIQRFIPGLTTATRAFAPLLRKGK